MHSRHPLELKHKPSIQAGAATHLFCTDADKGRNHFQGSRDLYQGCLVAPAWESRKEIQVMTRGGAHGMAMAASSPGWPSIQDCMDLTRSTCSRSRRAQCATRAPPNVAETLRRSEAARVEAATPQASRRKHRSLLPEAQRRVDSRKRVRRKLGNRCTMPVMTGRHSWASSQIGKGRVGEISSPGAEKHSRATHGTDRAAAHSERPASA